MSSKEQDKRQRINFSLTSGGPTYEFLKWSHLSGDRVQNTTKRVIVFSAITWLPLLILSLIEGNFVNPNLEVAFLDHIQGHVRFLVALPLLIGVEPYVQFQLGHAVQRFIDRKIIRESDIPKFDKFIERAHRIRNSVWSELALVVLVFTIGVWVWTDRTEVGSAKWFAAPDQASFNLTYAGIWFFLVSMPVFQFVLVRWYARFLLLFWLLWKVSRLSLNLIATHPDRAAGLGFLGRVTYAFTPILIAQGALLSGMIASQIYHYGGSLTSFVIEIVGYVAFFVIAVLLPLCVFIPKLMRAKRKGLALYGILASRYIEEFHDKWIGNKNPANEPLLGSSDIQSLADLGNSYDVVQEMYLAPFTYRDILRLTAATAFPLAPLLFFMFSPAELLRKIVEVVL